MKHVEPALARHSAMRLAPCRGPSSSAVARDTPGPAAHGAHCGAALALAARVLAISVLAGLGGCDTLRPPAAWEKDVLARPEMRMDAAPLESRFGRQVYDSKESPSGGGDVGGGGCGCN